MKEHEKTPYETPKYEEKPVEPTKLPEIYEVPLKEITPGYYKPKEEYKPTEEPKGQLISKCLWCHCLDQNSNENIVRISALKVFIASLGLPGSFFGLLVGFLINV